MKELFFTILFNLIDLLWSTIVIVGFCRKERLSKILFKEVPSMKVKDTRQLVWDAITPNVEPKVVRTTLRAINKIWLKANAEEKTEILIALGDLYEHLRSVQGGKYGK